MLIAARNAFTTGGAKGWGNPYVTDGLIAMWDGEWNAGGGVHDAAATVWKDLVGTNDLTLPADTTWEANCLRWTNTGDKGMTISDVSAVKGIEVVFSIHQFRSNNFGAIYGGDASAGISGPVGNLRSIKDYLMFNFAGTRYTITTDQIVSGVCLAAGGNVYPYVNSSPLSAISYTPTSGNIIVNDLGGYTGRSMLMSVMSLRLYSITDYDRAANYAIDKARFNLP